MLPPKPIYKVYVRSMTRTFKLGTLFLHLTHCLVTLIIYAEILKCFTEAYAQSLRTDFTSKLVHVLEFGTPKFYIAPYDKIKHELVNLSSNCDVKSGLSADFDFYFEPAACRLDKLFHIPPRRLKLQAGHDSETYKQQKKQTHTDRINSICPAAISWRGHKNLYVCSYSE